MLRSMLRQGLLYIRTVRHLRPVQVFGRVVPEAKRRLSKAGLIPVRVWEVPAKRLGRLQPQTPFLFHDPWNFREDLKSGVFCFLNEARNLGWPPRWLEPSLPILWNYNLHYFNYLHLLEEDEQVKLCKAWIDDNPPGRTVGWYPYPLSLRIVNWCKAGLRDPAVIESLYRQAYYLSRNMEVYHPGNHLLENARSLVMAARYFEGGEHADAWMRAGLRILRKELPVQVLNDGGYFERSPMYHAIMLEGFLDLCNVLPVNHDDRPMMAAVARRMCDLLASTTHPDGEIALFNDSTHEIAQSPSDLLDYAFRVLEYRPGVLHDFEDTGYFVTRSPELFLIVDGGPVGPDFIPAHAHADIFSFELSVNGTRFVVDSGTFDYVPGAFRSHLRGTRAHNTVCVDDVDQVECWKSHRVGRRFYPREVKTSTSPGEWSFTGLYDGYSTLIGDGVVHERNISVNYGDKVISFADEIRGSGSHKIESRVHIHPDVHVYRENGGLILEREDTWVHVTGDLEGSRLEEGVYCPRFGVKIANTVLVLGGSRDLPATLHFQIHF